MNAKRDQMPPNIEMDEKHEIYKEALIEYLTTKAGRKERKEIVKEAINEWLDDKFQKVGRWTVSGVMAATVALLGYMILWSNGWHK